MSNHPGINAALFNFCNSVNDGPREEGAASALPKRSPEELQWLREALAAVEAPDRIVKRLLEQLMKMEHNELEESDAIEALEELSDTVEDINWAVEFSLMKGHVLMIRLLDSSELARKSAAVRTQIGLVIAHAAQQNEKVQAAFGEAKWAEVLVPALKRETDKTALAALLHACSCMCRECDDGTAAFIAQGGADVLNRLLDPSQSDMVNEKILQRILFLVMYLAQVGISSESLIRSTVAQVASSSESVSIAAAATTVQLLRKSPAAVTPILRAATEVVTFVTALAGVPAEDPRLALRKHLS